jgi:magnesium-protoporphyrin O-methyltransferase
MPSCCHPNEYESVFNSREAARTASRFRRRGLAGSASDLVALVAKTATPGDTLLEVGGGVGEIQLALLERGVVSSAINVELSPSWEEAAQILINDRGLAGRVKRVVADFVDEARNLPEAGLVVLHRVVCCYPDWESMVDAVSSRARCRVAMTFPIDRWYTRTVVGLGNLVLRLRGVAFRAYIHRPEAIIGRLGESGFELVGERTRVPWQTVLLERSGAVS